MSDIAFDDIVSVLSTTGRRWMTANGIARKLPNGVDASEVESLLIDHCSECETTNRRPTVRYSSLPSRRTLEVLWGLVEIVGVRKLANITKDDVADESLDVNDYGSHADVFVSHSHRDYQHVIKIAAALLEEDLVPWLAETHIQRDDHIHERIIDALSAVNVFLLFLSPNALGSRWTGKEYGRACQSGIPIFVVANIDSPEIRQILQALAEREVGQRSAVDDVNGDVRQFLQDLITDRDHIVEMFSYSAESPASELHEIPVRPLSELPSAIRVRQRTNTAHKALNQPGDSG